jgi:hypothetical protein
VPDDFAVAAVDLVGRGRTRASFPYRGPRDFRGISIEGGASGSDLSRTLCHRTVDPAVRRGCDVVRCASATAVATAPSSQGGCGPAQLGTRGPVGIVLPDLAKILPRTASDPNCERTRKRCASQVRCAPLFSLSTQVGVHVPISPWVASRRTRARHTLHISCATKSVRCDARYDRLPQSPGSVTFLCR